MGSPSLAKAHAYIRRTQVDCLRAAGLPLKAAEAWTRLAPWRFSGNFKRDADTGAKLWRGGTDLLAKLPKKPRRTPEQQMAADFILTACRTAREDFLQHHAETVYRKLTKNLAEFKRVDELAYDAARLVPRPDADTQAGRCRKRVDAKRERRRRDRPGHLPRAGAGRAADRHASLPCDAYTETGRAGARRGVHQKRRGRFRPRESRAAGQGCGGHR